MYTYTWTWTWTWTWTYLVAVDVENRNDTTALSGVNILVGMPCRGSGATLALAVTDDSNSDAVRRVHDRSVGDGEGIAELTTLVDRTRSLG
jgi:hypothetical protein